MNINSQNIVHCGSNSFVAPSTSLYTISELVDSISLPGSSISTMSIVDIIGPNASRTDRHSYTINNAGIITSTVTNSAKYVSYDRTTQSSIERTIMSHLTSDNSSWVEGTSQYEGPFSNLSIPVGINRAASSFFNGTDAPNQQRLTDHISLVLYCDHNKLEQLRTVISSAQSNILSGSTTGYIKLALYIMKSMGSTTLANNNVVQGWNPVYLGNNVGGTVVGPGAAYHFDNYNALSGSNTNLQSNAARIANGECGWIHVPGPINQVTPEVLRCMALFYEPYPQYVVTTDANAGGAKLVEDNFKIPGAQNVIFNTRFTTVLGIDVPPAIPPINGIPKTSDLLSAWHLLVKYRREQAQADSGWLAALLMTSGTNADALATVDQPDLHTFLGVINDGHGCSYPMVRGIPAYAAYITTQHGYPDSSTFTRSILSSSYSTLAGYRTLLHNLMSESRVMVSRTHNLTARMIDSVRAPIFMATANPNVAHLRELFAHKNGISTSYVMSILALLAALFKVAIPRHVFDYFATASPILDANPGVHFRLVAEPDGVFRLTDNTCCHPYHYKLYQLSDIVPCDGQISGLSKRQDPANPGFVKSTVHYPRASQYAGYGRDDHLEMVATLMAMPPNSAAPPTMVATRSSAYTESLECYDVLTGVMFNISQRPDGAGIDFQPLILWMDESTNLYHGYNLDVPVGQQQYFTYGKVDHPILAKALVLLSSDDAPHVKQPPPHQARKRNMANQDETHAVAENDLDQFWAGVFVNVPDMLSMRPHCEKPKLVACANWSADRPSITYSDMIHVEYLHTCGYYPSDDYKLAQEWFAPWATSTHSLTTAYKWWLPVKRMTNTMISKKNNTRNTVVLKCFRTYGTNRTDWKSLLDVFMHHDNQEASHSLMDLPSAMVIYAQSVPRSDPKTKALITLMSDSSDEISRSMIAILALWLCGIPKSYMLIHLCVSWKLTSRSRVDFRDMTKLITVAIQRTAALPNNKFSNFTLLDPSTATALCYLQECTGRAGWQTDWATEKAERTGPGAVINLIAPNITGVWNAESYDTFEDEVIAELMRSVFTRATVMETAERHYQRRVEWMASGSCGGAHVLVPCDKPPMPTFTPPARWKTGGVVVNQQPAHNKAKVINLLCANSTLVLEESLTQPVSILTVSNVSANCNYYMSELEPGSDITGIRDSWKSFCDRVCGIRSTADHVRVRLSKRGYSESVDFNQLLAETIEPICKSQACEKFDRAAARALYAVTFEHFARSRYVFNVMERTSRWIDGLCGELNIGDQAYMDAQFTMLQALLYAVDHNNYNVIHSLIRQFKIIDAMRRIPCETEEIRISWDKEVTWLAQSMLNQHVRWMDGTHSKITQGLFSGMGGTSCLNDLLHVVYMLTVYRWSCRLYGQVTPWIDYKIRGDDVLMRMTSWIGAAMFHGCLMASKFRLNVSKQVFSASYGVFLRMMYSYKCINAFVLRSLGSLVLQPLQAETEYDPSARCGTLHTHIDMLVRRGCDHVVAYRLWMSMITYWARQKLTSDRYVDVPVRLLTVHSGGGGLGLSPPQCPVTITNIPRYPAVRLDTLLVHGHLHHKASQDYANLLSTRRGPGDVNPHECDVISKLSNEQNESSCIHIKDKQTLRETHAKQVIGWLKSCKSYKIVGIPARMYSRKLILAPPGTGKSVYVNTYTDDIPLLVDGDKLASRELFNNGWLPKDQLINARGKRDPELDRVLLQEPVAKCCIGAVINHGKIVMTAFSSKSACSIYKEARIPVVVVIAGAHTLRSQLDLRGDNDLAVVSAAQQMRMAQANGFAIAPSLDKAVCMPAATHDEFHTLIAFKLMAGRNTDTPMSVRATGFMTDYIKSIGKLPISGKDMATACAHARGESLIEFMIRESHYAGQVDIARSISRMTKLQALNFDLCVTENLSVRMLSKSLAQQVSEAALNYACLLAYPDIITEDHSRDANVWAGKVASALIWETGALMYSNT